jgi:hypothetical protein
MKNKKPVYEQIQELKHEFFLQNKTVVLSVVRVKKDLATELILQNESIVLGGKVYWFNVKPLGLGIFEISLNTEIDSRTTRLIK